MDEVDLEAQNQSGFDIDFEIERVEKKINGLHSDTESEAEESLHRVKAFDESKKKHFISPDDIILEVDEEIEK